MFVAPLVKNARSATVFVARLFVNRATDSLATHWLVGWLVGRLVD